MTSGCMEKVGFSDQPLCHDAVLAFALNVTRHTRFSPSVPIGAKCCQFKQPLKVKGQFRQRKRPERKWPCLNRKAITTTIPPSITSTTTTTSTNRKGYGGEKSLSSGQRYSFPRTESVIEKERGMYRLATETNDSNVRGRLNRTSRDSKTAVKRRRTVVEKFVVRGEAPLGLILEERTHEECADEGKSKAVEDGGKIGQKARRKRAIVVAGVRTDELGSIGGKGLVRVGDVVVGISGTFGGMWKVGGSVSGVVEAVKSRRGKEVAMEVEREIVRNDVDNEVGALCEEWGRLRKVGAGQNVQRLISIVIEEICRDLLSPGPPGERGVKKVEDLIGCVVQRWKIDLGERAWNNIMKVFLKGRAPRRAVDVFAEIENPKVENYTTYITALGVLRRNTEALDVLREMREVGVEPNVWTYNAVIAACVRGGRLDRARVLFGEMVVAGIHPNTVSWNIIINWHVRQKRGVERLEGASKAFADMKASGIKPDVISYTTLMKAYAMSGRLGKAESILEEMRGEESDIEMDAGAYNSLLEVYVARHDWRRCVELLYEMKHARSLHAESHEARKGGKIRESNTAMNNRKPPLPDGVTYSFVIKACAESGQVERAEMVFKELLESGLHPPPTQAIMSLVRAYSRAGLLNKCYTLLQDLKKWKIRPGQEFLSALMSCSLRDDNPTLALDIYAKIKSLSIKPDAVTNTVLMKAYCLKEEYDHAFNVLRGMHKTAHPPNIITYNTLISQCLAKHEPQLALRALSLLLRDKNVRLNHHTFEALRPPEGMLATNALEYMLAVVENLKEYSFWAHGKLYVTMLELCAKTRKFALGRNIMENKEEWGFRAHNDESGDMRRCEIRFLEVAEERQDVRR